MDRAGLRATASVIARYLVDGLPEGDVIRLVVQASDDFASLDDDAARREFLREPAATGDARYDALLAGLAVHLAQRAALPTTPAWTREPSRYLPRMWWVGMENDSALRAYVLARTPAYLKARGVLFNVDNLASV